eukprot:CAMPEP_0181130940 /NCGR_PEP_ID=MMETSP1071-20121207/30142_1 /TAXON_ID=35127 /ORGANISM="Thalassiosira sp., Strain NH16" /LENGTH=584 /DNA_ID=CAMNT_0023217065 /DNA_START=111 /DNA_END=1861 /DNA_ORIENTATION=-
MGRGKNNNNGGGRRRASLDGPHHAPDCTQLQFNSSNLPTTRASTKQMQSNHRAICQNCNNPNCTAQNQPHPHLPPQVPLYADNSTPTSRQEIEDAIEFHWKNLTSELKRFLLQNPNELSLKKFVEYWTHPSRIDSASPNIAASVCGCSWYLALNYMSIGRVAEARALVLNGCFLQQCYNKPIEEIAALARTASGEDFRHHLPFFSDGLLAISSEDRISNFLRNKVSDDYQRRMAFATQTSQTKQKVRDYVDQISSDWDDGGRAGGGRRGNERRRRASLDAQLPTADSFIDIKLVDKDTEEEITMRYGSRMNLRSLFKKYAHDRNLNLRKLRFSYEGRTLFLSSVGNKSPKDLGIENLDSIVVTNSDSANPQQPPEDEGGGSSSDESKKSNNSSDSSLPTRKGGKKFRKHHRRASWSGPEIMDEEERLKLKHSRQLSGVFAEASPKFEQIRQKLNALSLSCTPPKVKRTGKKPLAIDPLPMVNNPNENGRGGKAGVPFYAIHVGENLYRVTKPLSQKSLSVDLHGMTQDEALRTLDNILPTWVNEAMRGSYPWVIPAVVICGGGNQILSEAVEGWIRRNENVAKA